jgi:hypothetical protein
MRNVAITAVRGFAVIFFLILLGCAADHPKEVYRAYSGIEPPENELATLDLGAGYEVIIDDMYYMSRKKYDSVKLIAGVHRIQWTTAFGVSVMVEPSGHVAFKMISNINLEAGHTYKLSADRTTGHGYKVYCWIEDTTTGKIVWGEKKP